MKRIFSVALAAALVGGCAIQQRVTPFTAATVREICVIDNPEVRAGFSEQLRTSLRAKGYEVRALPRTAALDTCPVMLTYTARWNWDLALYMSYAQITVYHAARPAGEAVYDSTRGGGNMSKFIDAEKKIRELVGQLFPGGAGR